MGLAGQDLARLWSLVAAGASAETALRDLLPAIVTEYGALGAALAAEWYDDQRAKADVRGTFTAMPVPAEDRGAQALIGWALATATDDSSLRGLVLGGVQRRIADHARNTIATAAVEDPASAGWQRVGSGECQFCRQLIARGAVYTERTADFGAHDHCNCSAVSAWKGRPKPVKPFTPSLRFRSDEARDAHNERTREWLASHT
ncbi:hypothetical protein [Nocardioides marinquilinus]|uniref:VG15 protein n=1 Tax=Nocardioides marinquilinus TaxID=1210400 RepID=UPI0031E9CC69